MAGDKPQFLQTVAETEEEKDIMSVLSDEPTKEVSDESNDKPEGDANDTPDKTNDSDSPSTDSDAGDTNLSTDDSTPSDGDTAKLDGVQDTDENGKPKDEKKEDGKEEEPKVEDLVNLKFGNFKSAEEAEKAYKELQRTLTKLTQKANQTPTTQKEAQEQKAAAQKYIELAKSTPLVDVKIPKAENYKLSNGNFDMDGFSRDLVRNTVMAVQQGLIGGQLGSVQFGMMSEALGEEWQTSQAQVTQQKEAQAIEKELYSAYPIIEKNEKIGKMYERAILGEYTRRKNQDGENFKPLVKEDYLSIAQDLVENLNLTTEPKKVEQADTPRGQGVLQPEGTSKLTGVDKDIEDMMNTKSKTGSIF